MITSPAERGSGPTHYVTATRNVRDAAKIPHASARASLEARALTQALLGLTCALVDAHHGTMRYGQEWAFVTRPPAQRDTTRTGTPRRAS